MGIRFPLLVDLGGWLAFELGRMVDDDGLATVAARFRRWPDPVRRFVVAQSDSPLRFEN